MIKVKQLYALWTSDDGDKKLIPKEQYKDFISTLEVLEGQFEMYSKCGSDMSIEKAEGVTKEIWELIDTFDTLEGEEVFVVLPEDIIEGEG